jgi:hypothetical protein
MQHKGRTLRGGPFRFLKMKLRWCSRGRLSASSARSQGHGSARRLRETRIVTVQKGIRVKGNNHEESCKLAERGGKNAKKRAVVVARKLSILLHGLRVSGEDYELLRNQHAVSTAA